MPIIFKKAPGKVILFGEHAVVYGQPAIAIPIREVNATARILPDISPKPGHIHLQAEDIQLDADYADLPENHPLAAAVRLTLQETSPIHIPSFTIQISSTIPISAGMGSGAAVTVALIRALSSFLGTPLPNETVSNLTYEVEKIHHGTPSGIDNTVITYEEPIYFERGNPLETIRIRRPTYWVIADTGEKTPTYETISAVREKHTQNPKKYNTIFEKIGSITQKARHALIQGEVDTLGQLMNENQSLLESLEVSSPALNALIEKAHSAGAVGAKLSGGGRGGNMIALAYQEKIADVEQSLTNAGAKRVIQTTLKETAQR